MMNELVIIEYTSKLNLANHSGASEAHIHTYVNK
jgi:hypothetical protein